MKIMEKKKINLNFNILYYIINIHIIQVVEYFVFYKLFIYKIFINRKKIIVKLFKF